MNPVFFFLTEQARFLVLMLKNLRRNLLRTILTCLATMVLVFVVTLIWTVLWELGKATEEKSKDLKAIVTEKWQIPSMMPYAYAEPLSRGAASKPGDIVPQDHMTWQFFGGTTDKDKQTWENIVFFFAMDPGKLRSMMDDLEDLDPRLQEKLQANKRGALVGRERLERMNRKVGDRITVTSVNYKDIELEFEIVGVFPEGRYNQSAVMHRDYLNDALDSYWKKTGNRHPMAEKTLGLVWLRVPDSDAFRQVAEQITSSPQFANPAVKCETASSGIASFLDAYRDLIAGMKYLLVPAILVTMTLVVANSIGISVRERRQEMAVLKVLGFRPGQILFLVLGEALLLGGGSGLLAGALTYFGINYGWGGLPFRIAFFPVFVVPIHALWWGFVMGAGTALAGSIEPARSACAVKVSEVFAKIA